MKVLRVLGLSTSVSLLAFSTMAAAQQTAPSQATVALGAQQTTQEAQPTPLETAVAQDATGLQPEAATDAAAAGTAVGDIIVTARRRSESLQNIPQTVNAVSGNTLEKLNIQRLEDVQSVVPGLNLASGNTGFNATATVRGAPFNTDSGASPTVEFYLNDALIPSIFLFQSTFDVGQIEVLRGPQGTLRGRASPSGSITVTTRRPDLTEAGGFVNMTGTSQGGINANGALNIPIVSDVLGIRVAGIVDQNEADQVRSIVNGVHPYNRSSAGRISARFEPASFLSANVVYQHLDRRSRLFDQHESLSVADPTATPSGLIIDAGDRLSTAENFRSIRQSQDVLNGQVNLKLAGQQLSYVGSLTTGTNATDTPQDAANLFPNFDVFNNLRSKSRQETHELRLSSVDRVLGVFDYTVGAFRVDTANTTTIDQGTIIAIGQRPVSTVRTPVLSDGGQDETSFFGNLTAHIGEKTELAGGLRHIIFNSDGVVGVNGRVLASTNRHNTPTIYNLSLSHRLSSQLLVYANTGTSWRSGPFAVGVFQALTDRERQFIDLNPETSQSYEIGIKSTFFEGKFRFNLSGFRQDFDGFIYRGPFVPFVSTSTGVPTVNNFAFAANVDARIYGAELDLGYQITDRFSVGGTFSYANAKIQNSEVACLDLNGDGVPDRSAPTMITAAQLTAATGGQGVGACRINDRLSTTPNFTFTAQSEYFIPLSDQSETFVRGLYSFYGRNPGEAVNVYDSVPRYAILNVFAGIRAPNGQWEVSLFAKNLTNADPALSSSSFPIATGYQALQPATFRTAVGQSVTAPYLTTRTVAQREFGLNVRFAFGSR